MTDGVVENTGPVSLLGPPIRPAEMAVASCCWPASTTTGGMLCVDAGCTALAEGDDADPRMRGCAQLVPGLLGRLQRRIIGSPGPVMRRGEVLPRLARSARKRRRYQPCLRRAMKPNSPSPASIRA